MAFPNYTSPADDGKTHIEFGSTYVFRDGAWRGGDHSFDINDFINKTGTAQAKAGVLTTANLDATNKTDLDKLKTDAVIKTPTADQTITAAFGRKPLEIDATAETGTTPQLSVTDGGATVFEVDKGGGVKGLDSTRGATSSWYELNSVGVLQVQRHSSTAGSGAGSLVARFMTGGAGSTAADTGNAVLQANHLADIADSDNQYLISCRTGLTTFNDASSTNTKFTVKGDGSGYFAGGVGVGRAAPNFSGLYLSATVPAASSVGTIFSTLGAGSAVKTAAVVGYLADSNNATTDDQYVFRGTVANKFGGDGGMCFNVKGDGSGYFASGIGVGIASAPTRNGVTVTSPTTPSGAADNAVQAQLNSSTVGSSAVNAYLATGGTNKTGTYAFRANGAAFTDIFQVNWEGTLKTKTVQSDTTQITSDPRLKTPFTAADYTLDHLSQIEVGHYSMLDDPDSVEHLGHNAADFADHIPHCMALTNEPVPEHADLYYDDVEVDDGEGNTTTERQRNSQVLLPEHATKAVNVGAVIALHTHLLKHAHADNEAQKDLISDLRHDLQLLEHRLEALENA